MSAEFITPTNQADMMPCLRALSDPIRLTVIELLRNQEMCVRDICEALEIKQPKLSFHLKALRESGLLNSRQQGRWIYYSINSLKFESVVAYLSGYLECHIRSSQQCC